MTAALYATNPAVEIWSHPAGASARITNLRSARLTIAVGAVLIASAVAIVIANDRAVIYLPISLAIPILSGTIATSIETLRIARAIRDKTATHLLTDVTRHPTGEPGSGTLLVTALADTDRRIVGVAANADLWEKVYAETATATGRDSNGAIHFALRREVF